MSTQQHDHSSKMNFLEDLHPAHKLKILFLCTGNSCRSQMAEGWARALKSDPIEAFSAGIETHGLNPRAVQVMAETGVDISGHRSKTVAELPTHDFDYVVTVCDHAHESCPIFPGKTKVVHAGFDDPPRLAKNAQTEEEALVHYRRVRDEIKAFVETLPDALNSATPGRANPPGEPGSTTHHPRLGRDASPYPTAVSNPSSLGRANPPGEPGSKTHHLRLGRDASPYPTAPAAPSPSGRANPPGEPGSTTHHPRLGRDASPYPTATAAPSPSGRANPPGEPGSTTHHPRLGRDASPYPTAVSDPSSSGRANPPGEPPNSLPKRKKLPHEVPAWVAQGARHFITINCRHKSESPLLTPDIARALLESAAVYEQLGHWYLWLMVIMPDHVHLIATFNLDKGIQNTVRAWKSHQAKFLKVAWQSGFFEHRLRNEKEFDEKSHYVRWNPVRKGLVQSPEKWPFILDRTRLGRDASPYPTAPAAPSPSGRANPPGEPGSTTHHPRLGRDASPYPTAVSDPSPSGRANPPGEPGSTTHHPRLGRDASPYPTAVSDPSSSGRANPPGEPQEN